MWATAGLGRVVGITPSQSARNTLAAGVPECYNTAQFLGHLPGQRGARGPAPLQPGDVVLVDEASMVASPDLADLIAQAADSGVKVILAGDTQQLQAVEAAAVCRCSLMPWGSRSWPSRSGSASNGNRQRACGSAPETPRCWPTTTSTPGSAAVSRSR